MNLGSLKLQHRRRLGAVSSEEIVALLEPGIEIEGQIRVSDGMVRLNCHFKGAIYSAGTVIVASEGDIEADINATQISIAGKVKGNVHASKQLEITEEGILIGNVETPLLKVDTGAYFTGHCDMLTQNLEKSAPNEVVPECE